MGLPLFILGLLPMTAPGSPAAPLDCPPPQARLLTDFTPNTQDLGWYVLNDNVMGGRSEGGFEIRQARLRFTGRTNTNGGGFSSIRTGALRIDLASWTGVRLRVRGDGRRYTWRLSSTAGWRGQPLGYWASFDTRPGAWMTVDIPFSHFVPRFRGSEVQAPPLDLRRITGMGLMIYDKRDGPFEIAIDGVSAYLHRTPLTLGRYRWKNRVLVVSAPGTDDAALKKMVAEAKATAAAFGERDMVLVTLLDRGTSRAGEVELTSEETACLRAEASIRPGAFALRLYGKDGGIKRSSETAVPLDEIYRQIDAMPMRQQEMKDRR